MSSILPSDEESLHGTRDWPHAPPHRLQSTGTYFVTARTIDRIEYFQEAAMRDFVCAWLLELASRYGWQMEAWTVLSNHYHFVAHSPSDRSDANSLRYWLKHLHADITRQINRADGVQGRKIWHNYRDSLLTYQPSYLARLNYTHNNAVHHGLVVRPGDYRWCSAFDFERTCTPAWVKTIQSFRYDQIAQDDDDL